MASVETTYSGPKVRIVAGTIAAVLLLWLGAFAGRHGWLAWPAWWLEAGLITLFAIVGMRRWPLAIDAAIVAMPLCLMLPMRLGVPNYSIAEIALLATALGAALRVARTGQFRWVATPVTAWMVLLGLTALFSAALYFVRWHDVMNLVFARVLLGQLGVVFQLDKNAEFHALRGTLTLLGGLVFFHAVAARVRDFRHVRHLVQLSLFSAVLVALFGIGQYFTNWNRVDFEPWRHRINSTFPDVNSLASFLVANLFFLLPLLTREGWKPRGMGWWALPLLCVGLWMAHSRIALGAAIVTLPLYFALLSRRFPLEKRVVWLFKKRSFLLLVYVFLLAVLGFAATGLDWLDHTDLEWTRSTGAVAQALKGRLNIWRSALYNLAEEPWLGCGTGMFYTLSFHHREPVVGGGEWNWNPYFENAHNYFIQIFTETGVVGGGLLLGILGLVLYQGLRAVVIHRNGERALLAGVLCGVVAFLLTCLTGHPLVLVDVNLWFWFTAALVFVAHEKESREYVIGQTRWRRAQSLALAAVVLLAAGRLADAYWPYPPKMIGYGLHALEGEDGGGAPCVYQWLEKRAVCRLYQARPDVEFSLRNVLGEQRPISVVIRVNGREIDRFVLGDRRWRLCRYRLPDTVRRMIRLEILSDHEWTLPNDRRRFSIQIQSLAENSWL
ncbi:MAG: O-antigen ligase family protein [Candidatus Sumerlaeia bacterium]|nr:O-antigen ligase family protein [Candidatus Sumerlaeia bacterium]